MSKQIKNDMVIELWLKQTLYVRFYWVRFGFIWESASNYSKHTVSAFIKWVLVSFSNRPVIISNTMCNILLGGFWFHLIIVQ